MVPISITLPVELNLERTGRLRIGPYQHLSGQESSSVSLIHHISGMMPTTLDHYLLLVLNSTWREQGD
jgi:hypothetical protein